MRWHTAIATLAVLLVVAGAISEGVSQATARAGNQGRVPQPDIARGKGEACVADTAFMRRNHMTVLDHQRDETVREGMRGKPFSLRECVACHAVPGADGAAVGADDPGFFCNACHEYVAVRIDCFECHASRPGERDENRGEAGQTTSLDRRAAGLPIPIQWQ